MKTEIKFRVWDKFQKKYIFEGFHVIGEVTVFGGIDSVINETWKERSKQLNYQTTIEAWDDFVVELFSGLKDKNAKDIYEGDILLGWSTKFEVEFINGSIGYFTNKGKDFKEFHSFATHLHLSILNGICSQLEVVGSINKNPEVLKK